MLSVEDNNLLTRVEQRMRRLEGRFGLRFRPAPSLVERAATG